MQCPSDADALVSAGWQAHGHVCRGVRREYRRQHPTGVLTWPLLSTIAESGDSFV
jgi:hypothetical protein